MVGGDSLSFGLGEVLFVFVRHSKTWTSDFDLPDARLSMKRESFTVPYERRRAWEWVWATG